MTYVKSYLLGAAIVLTPVSLVAQYPPQAGTQVASSNPMDSSLSGSAGADVEGMKDKMFVKQAAEGGNGNVEMGKLAAAKASNDDVKKFGQRMVDDHTLLLADLKPVADELGIKTSTKLNKNDTAELAKLNTLSDTNFDKEYIAYMLKDHDRDLHDFQAESSNTLDPTLKEVAARQERVIARHLRMAYHLATTNGVPVPSTPAPAAPTQ